MSLQDTLKTVVSKTINSTLKNLGLARTVTHVSIIAPRFEPSDGSVDPANEKQLNMEAVFIDFQEREIDGHSVVVGDVKALMAQVDFNVIPKIGDQIIEGSKKWRIINPKEDPASATWTLHLRI